MSLTKSGIEYLTHCWNFQTGCLHWKTGVCAVGENCWAKIIAHRFHRSFEPTLHPELLLDPLKRKKPVIIGVCFTGDLFGDWADPNQPTNVHWELWGKVASHNMTLAKTVRIVTVMAPQHTFLFLTKNPKGYQKWGKFPDNAWLGATVNNQSDVDARLSELCKIESSHNWVSVEPLLEHIDVSHYLSQPIPGASWYEDNRGIERYDLNGAPLNGIDWVVIGAQSGRHPIQPKIEWVKEIVEAADKAGIPVWLKDNMVDLFHIGDNHDQIYFPPWATARGFYRQQRPF